MPWLGSVGKGGSAHRGTQRRVNVHEFAGGTIYERLFIYYQVRRCQVIRKYRKKIKNVGRISDETHGVEEDKNTYGT